MKWRRVSSSLRRLLLAFLSVDPVDSFLIHFQLFSVKHYPLVSGNRTDDLIRRSLATRPHRALRLRSPRDERRLACAKLPADLDNPRIRCTGERPTRSKRNSGVILCSQRLLFLRDMYARKDVNPRSLLPPTVNSWECQPATVSGRNFPGRFLFF